MRIAIFGTGGVGGHFGAELARAGHDVAFIARGEHLKAIRAHGLHVETAQGVIVINPATATDTPAEVGPVDFVFVCVKSWQVAETARAIPPLIGPGTVIVPMQNGVEAAAQLVEVLGAPQVLGGLCGTFSWVAAPGRIRSIGSTHFVKLGELNGQPSARVERLRMAFAEAGVDVQVPTDITVALWEKFLFVVPVGGLGALTRSPIGLIRAVPETRSLLEDCMREVATVARARRIVLAGDIIERTMRFVDTLSESGTSSLQRDMADGKPSELEAWTGAVVRLGRESGVSTPLHEFTYRCLLPLELRARGRIGLSDSATRPG